MANPKPEELLNIDYTPSKTGWMDTPTVNSSKASSPMAVKEKSLETLNFPNPRHGRVKDEDWKLPENWQEIFLED